jgi:16S rRNA processing protein RimM
MHSEPQWIVIAHLVRPQGRHGELLADILTDFASRFSERRDLALLDAEGKLLRSVVLEKHWLHKDRVVLKFSGIDTISDAESLRGLDVAIPREQRAPLDEDSVYISDLVGCRVIDLGGIEPRDVGEIISVDRETTSTPLLILESSERGEELLIPFARAYLRTVDIAHKQVAMSLPEGLLDINSDKEQG